MRLFHILCFESFHLPFEVIVLTLFARYALSLLKKVKWFVCLNNGAMIFYKLLMLIRRSSLLDSNEYLKVIITLKAKIIFHLQNNY